jgi:hypothetical protein
MTTATLPGRLSYSIRTAAEATGFSKTYLIDAINDGKMKARRSSKDDKGEPQGKWVILAADLEAFLASLPEG